LQIKRGKANCSSFEQTWPRPFIGDGCLLIIVSFVHPNLFNKRSALPSALYPLLGFRLPCLRRSLVSVASMARDSRGRLCKEEAPRPRPRPSSLVLSATPSKRVRFRGDKEDPSQRAAPMRLPRRSMEEAGSSSARGRKPYTRARAKLADSSDACHGEAGFFPQHEGRSSPRALR
jgi:hypothetical protein